MEWTRRTLFPLALLAAAPLGAGCSGDGDGGPDGRIRQRAAAQAAGLAALYGDAETAGAAAAAVGGSRAASGAHAAAGPSAAPADPRFAVFRDHHLTHRALLLSGASNPATANPAVPAADLAAPGPGPSADSRSGAPPGAPAGASVQPTAANLTAAERAASSAAGPDLATASGRLAGLLADIAACRAVHCAALDPAGAQAAASAAVAPDISLPTAEDVTAAQAILSAEHAAVYAYGALTPHLRGAQRDQAHGLYELHRQIRDALEAGIAAHGATPTPMVAAYAFPQLPDDPASAAALAGYVETRVAAVCANATTVATAAGRPYTAWSVVSASLRAYGWGRAPAAFPATFSA